MDVHELEELCTQYAVCRTKYCVQRTPYTQLDRVNGEVSWTFVFFQIRDMFVCLSHFVCFHGRLSEPLKFFLSVI